MIVGPFSQISPTSPVGAGMPSLSTTCTSITGEIGRPTLSGRCT